MIIKKIPEKDKFFVIGEKLLEFLDREPTLTKKRHKEIKAEYEKIKELLEKGKISKKEYLKIENKLDKEMDKATILFEDADQYWLFTLTLLGDKKMALSVFNHEIAHSKPFTKAGIACRFGWTKFKGEEFPSKAFMFPYSKKYDSLPREEKDKLGYISGKAVDKPSDGDIYSIKMLEKKYGKDKCDKWLLDYDNK